ncbi:MAG: thymidine phosphorylase, partial [Rhodococcus sp.]|nr:thymidine phosphorylase [Rhodococcus sp. (in: high G+C Gram-positive bacteria)]
MPDIASVIRHKRDGLELTGAEIDWVIRAFTHDIVADEQMAALAMAIWFRGMTRAETARWTTAMIDSGRRLDFTGLGVPTVDKHSTGG